MSATNATQLSENFEKIKSGLLRRYCLSTRHVALFQQVQQQRQRLRQRRSFNWKRRGSIKNAGWNWNWNWNARTQATAASLSSQFKHLFNKNKKKKPQRQREEQRLWAKMNNFTTTTAAVPKKESLPRSGHVNEGKRQTHEHNNNNKNNKSNNSKPGDNNKGCSLSWFGWVSRA